MAYKLVKTEGGKTNWPLLRKVFYVGLIVWAVGVRLANINPFDDIMNNKIDLNTVLDGLVLWGMAVLVWFIIYPMRPRIEPS